jgi:GNAT superfamily N-acetyltransferase
MSQQAVRDKVTRLANQPADRIYVAEIEGDVVGVLSFHITPLLHAEGNSGRITAMVVASEYRHQGIGTLLVQEAEAWAWSQGCSMIEVTSGDQRPRAHRFYESRGYKCDERRFLKFKPTQHEGKGNEQ